MKKVRLFLLWAVSPEGRKDLGAFIGTVTAIYVSLHRSGIL